MVNISELKILLHAKKETFFPGDIVNGHVLLELQKATEIKGVELKFEGT